MHRINKKREDISSFNNWAKSKRLKRWEEFSAKSSPYNDAYLQVRSYIKETEQRGLSAYTEKPLGTDIHIDHFRKRNLYPAQTYDYANLLVDDINDNYGARYKDNQAGVSKNTFIGPGRIFCPVDEDMSELITYSTDGTMSPKRDLSEAVATRVSETIRVFNLNHSTLKGIRSTLISQINSYRSNLTAAEIRQCLEGQGFPSLVNWALRV